MEKFRNRRDLFDLKALPYFAGTNLRDRAYHIDDSLNVYSAIAPGRKGDMLLRLNGTSAFNPATGRYEVLYKLKCTFGDRSIWQSQIAVAADGSTAFGDYKAKIVNSFINAVVNKENTMEKTSQSYFIVGSDTGNGTLSFSASPKRHDTFTGARLEAERLAVANPGKAFTVFEFKGKVRAGGVSWS